MPASTAEAEEEATYEMVDAPAAEREAEQPAEPEQAAPPAQHVVPVEDVVIITSREELQQAMAQQEQQPQEAIVKKGGTLQAHPLPALQDVQWEAAPEASRFLPAWMRLLASFASRHSNCAERCTMIHCCGEAGWCWCCTGAQDERCCARPAGTAHGAR
jgi:hypothetical protein